MVRVIVSTLKIELDKPLNFLNFIWHEFFYCCYIVLFFVFPLNIMLHAKKIYILRSMIS